jgi:hypothetical protein
MKNLINVLFVAMLLLVGICIFVLAGCSPQKRLNRLLANHPELVQTDTLFVTDTVRTLAVRVDTVQDLTDFIRIASGDTFFIEKERLSVKTWIRRDSIYFDAECKADTIYRSVPRYITRISAEKPPDMWYWLGIGMAGGAILATVVWFGLVLRK